jgi:hypothetical protein
MSIANHIYVFNNPAYTTKTTPLELKKKKKKPIDGLHERFES